jgi:mRNA interferase RelE/StbE
MIFNIAYHYLVVREDISKLSTTDKDRIKRAIDEKLTKSPEIFGKPLRYSLRGYKKLRVGDYRVVFRVEEDMIKIFYIGHRSYVYKNIKKRNYLLRQ